VSQKVKNLSTGTGDAGVKFDPLQENTPDIQISEVDFSAG
jgi:hypothetical protein